MPRPRSDNPRTVRFTVLLTTAERRRLRRDAFVANESESELARRRIFPVAGGLESAPGSAVSEPAAGGPGSGDGDG